MKKDQTKNTEKGKSGNFRIKALDVVIILLVLAAVVGVYFRFNVIDTITNKSNIKECRVSFAIKDIRYTTADYIGVGDKIYYSNGEELGSLIEASNDSINALTVRPASKTVVSSNGEAVTITYPVDTRIDAEGRFICKCSVSSDGAYLVDGTKRIAAGETVSVYTEKVSLNILITDIELVQ